MEINYEALGKRVRVSRKVKDFTQEKLAEKTGLSISHISNIETGTTKIGLKTLVLIADALETKPDDLLCDSLKHARENFEYHFAMLTQDCNEYEIRIITDIVENLKLSIRKRSSELLQAEGR